MRYPYERIDEEANRIREDFCALFERKERRLESEGKKEEDGKEEEAATGPRLDRIASITVGTIEAISERWSGGGESSALST